MPSNICKDAIEVQNACNPSGVLKYALVRMNDSKVIERFPSRKTAVEARRTRLDDGTIKGTHGVVYTGHTKQR